MQFPSMASLQGALPNMGAPPTLMRASSFGPPPVQWAPQVPSYPTAMPPSILHCLSFLSLSLLVCDIIFKRNVRQHY